MEALAVLLILFYLLPSAIAWSRSHHNLGPVMVVNVLLGWTFIGWVAALAMSTSRVRTDV